MNLFHAGTLALFAVGSVPGHAADHTAPPAETASAVHVVMSPETHRGILDRAQDAQFRRNASGTSLVLARIDADAREALVRHVHESEQRCGGFFAFDTLQEAEAFLADDRSAYAQALPLGGIYTIDNHATVDPWLDLVGEANIRGTIQTLSAFRNRYYTSSYGTQAAQWIRDQWQALAAGRSDVSVELFTACSNCGGQPSVIMTVAGNELASEVVVIGGHLDSTSNSGGGNERIAPGADDDASGIATITEVVRIALASGWKPARTIKFMGYAAEEVGLNGSTAIASSFADANINVVGVLQLDMTNYKDGAAYDMQRISDNSNAALKAYFGELFAAYLAPRGLVLTDLACGYGCSDHASWTAKGFPAAMMFEAGKPRDPNDPWDLGDFPYIHSTGDTLANMGNSATHSVKFAQFGLAFIGELGKTHVPTSNQAPTAAFNHVASGMNVQFTDASTDADGTIVSRHWDFGDGSTSTQTNPLKAYAAVGTDQVALTVTDNGSLPNLHSESIEVDNGVLALVNGVAHAGVAALEGADQAFTLLVPAGQTRLSFSLAGTTGEDPDLAVSLNGNVVCTSESAGANETCVIDSPVAGTWHASVHAASALGGFSITGSFDALDRIFADAFE